jgi:hypothetical protein
VVARQQQPPLGLVQAHVRRRVAGRLDDLPLAEVRRDRRARHQLAIDDELPRHPGPRRAPLLRPAAERPLGHAGLAGDLDAARDRLLRRLVAGVQVPVGGVHPDLRAGSRAECRRLAAVVDVRVRTHDQPDVLGPEGGLVERPLQVCHRAGLVHARVHEDDPVAGRERPRVAVRDARPREREAQPPHAGQHALAAPHLASACRLAHRAGR